MTPNLEDKNIIITGASKGLGLVCAQTLAECGARVVLLARSEEILNTLKSSLRNPNKHIAVAGDLTDFVVLEKSIKKATGFLGHVDVVLHVAGGGLGLKSELLTAQDFSKLFALNVLVASEINRLLIPKMKERKSGNLVHVGSIASTEGVGSVGYNTVKAGLAAYVRTLGRELADSNVIVTGILPGGFLAPENAMDHLKKFNPEAYSKFEAERLPRKFMADAKELMPMLRLLCTEQASMMSGCMVPIDAGEGRAYCN